MISILQKLLYMISIKLWKGDVVQTEDLITRLIEEGSRVMLTTNLDVEDRLINGQIGHS